MRPSNDIDTGAIGDQRLELVNLEQNCLPCARFLQRIVRILQKGNQRGKSATLFVLNVR